jgi:hypothetical protein
MRVNADMESAIGRSLKMANNTAEASKTTRRPGCRCGETCRCGAGCKCATV